MDANAEASADGENIAMVTDDGLPGSGPDDGDDVKTRDQIFHAAAAEVPAGGADEEASFIGADGGFRRAEVFGGAGADFNEDDVGAIEGDEVQFATGAEDIAGQHGVMESAAGIAGGEAFATGTEGYRKKAFEDFLQPSGQLNPQFHA